MKPRLKMLDVNQLSTFVQNTIDNLHYSEEIESLYTPVKYIMSLSGKRLRPLLALLTYNMFNQKIDNNILYPAVGIELFHNYTLIHDDIMDNSDIRRMKPTVHKKWGNNAAILSGDVMNIKAYHYLCQCNKEHLQDILEVFNKTAAQVCEGQQLDMEFETRESIGEGEYLEMIKLKTAVLIACASKIGAICGGAGDKARQQLYDYGIALGMGFQIKDDLLDCYGSENWSKPIGGDIYSNKKSWLLVYAQSQCKGDDAAKLKQLLEQEYEREYKIQQVLEIYNRIGAREAAEQKILQYHQKAMEILDSIALPEEHKTIIKEYTLSILKRTK